MSTLRQLMFVGCVLAALSWAGASDEEGFASGDAEYSLIWQDAEEEAEFAELEAIFSGKGTPVAVELPKWLWIGNVGVQAGYDDNPLRGEMAQGSALLQPQLDFILLWLPDSGFRGTLMTFYEGRYFSRSEMDPEHVAAIYATGEWQRLNGKTILALDTLYARQVYDATVLRESPERTVGLITQVRPRIRLRHERSLSPDWFLEPSVTVAYSDFREIEEDHWTYEGEIRIGRGQRSGTRMEWYAGGGQDRYLDSPERGALGLGIADTRLRIQFFTTGTKGILVLDKKAQWTLSLDAAVTYENDREGSYFERWRYSLTPEVRWRKNTWDIRARAGWRHTDYAERLLTAIDASTEWNRRWSGSIEVHYEWSEALSSQVRWEINDLDSNRGSIVYRQRQITAGTTYHF